MGAGSRSGGTNMTEHLGDGEEQTKELPGGDKGAVTTGVVGAAAGAYTGVTGTTIGGAEAGAVARAGVLKIKAYFNGVDTPIMLGETTLLVKIIGSIRAVSTGLDLGKEESLIHIGSYIASLLGQGGSDNVNLAVVGVLFVLEAVATWWRSALIWRTSFTTAVVSVVQGLHGILSNLVAVRERRTYHV
ncbi:Chloride channel protein CLC-a [Capsicum baccatum]|uniref:Chloride channel protein CLC-a n=1 Tax=Capsicum baccatum TaxID=33114 RepID=A0A2G2XH79_CAPBA|nr:Chloride channel protein CLC-a [Capsicum baccatum]